MASYGWFSKVLKHTTQFQEDGAIIIELLEIFKTRPLKTNMNFHTIDCAV